MFEEIGTWVPAAPVDRVCRVGRAFVSGVCSVDSDRVCPFRPLAVPEARARSARLIHRGVSPTSTTPFIEFRERNFLSHTGGLESGVTRPVTRQSRHRTSGDTHGYD